MEINERQFATICYLVLMAHHGAGINEAHPSYVEEKLRMLNEGYQAYGWLDRSNQVRVLAYLQMWEAVVPAAVAAYEQELTMPS